MIQLRNKLEELKRGFNKKSDLAVVSCYFNPCHYKSKFENYKIFRKGIIRTGVRFLTVELAFGDEDYELSEFPEVIQLRTEKENIMWQKERLLNIGIIKLIDEGYEKIAWLDADIIFEDDKWVEDLSEELDRYLICQVFSEVFIESLSGGENHPGSVKNYYDNGTLIINHTKPGGGWAARAEVLRRVLLFDLAIIAGENDVLMFFGCFYNNPKLFSNFNKSNTFKVFYPSFLSHYKHWAKIWGSLINCKVGFIDHKVRVLYHGEKENRKYNLISKLYKKYDFKPSSDLKLSSNLSFEWASNKPNFHEEVRNYFYLRKEDS
ncbi:MAG: hypothetical protein ABIH37_02840 [archaeon]